MHFGPFLLKIFVVQLLCAVQKVILKKCYIHEGAGGRSQDDVSNKLLLLFTIRRASAGW